MVRHHGYQCMKMPDPGGVISVLGDQQVACRIEVGYTPDHRNVHVITEPLTKPLEVKALLQVQKVPRAKPKGQTKKVLLCQDMLKILVVIEAQMTEEVKRRMIEFLRNNEVVFTWTPKDIQGVSRNIIEHTLNVGLNAKPKKQRLQKTSKEREEAAKAEV